MSQYPPPYAPPPYSDFRNPYAAYGAGDPLDIALRPARRASTLLWVFGGLTLLGALLFLGLSQVPKSQAFATADPAVRAQFQKMEEQMRMPLSQMLEIVAITMFAVSVVVIALGFGARRGGRASAVVGAGVCGVLLAWMGLNLVSGILLGGTQAVAGVCVLAIPIALLGAAMRDLIRAARLAPQVEALRQQRAQYGRPGLSAAPPAGYPGYPGAAAPPPPGYGPGYGPGQGPGYGDYGAYGPAYPPPPAAGPGAGPWQQQWPAPPPYGPPAPGAGGFGYAQAPVAPPVPQPPPGDTPVGLAPPPPANPPFGAMTPGSMNPPGVSGTGASDERADQR